MIGQSVDPRPAATLVSRGPTAVAPEYLIRVYPTVRNRIGQILSVNLNKIAAVARALGRERQMNGLSRLW